MAISNPATQLSWLLDQIDEAVAGSTDLSNGMADGYARVAWHFGLARQDDVATYVVDRRAGRHDEASELRRRILGNAQTLIG